MLFVQIMYEMYTQLHRFSLTVKTSITFKFSGSYSMGKYRRDDQI